ncbi:MAG: hypothetical protein JNK58_12520 [Phycisphaerae bacterium]|nr:hypothetical protein [Phycisphaerae bacterium]
MPDEPLPSTAHAGVRLGPVTWVPEVRTRANDPWAHRKGEPRPLALIWSLYLMASALVTLLRVRSLTMPTTEQFAFGCRSMLLMVMIGVALLWPMIRLSQQYPHRPDRSLFADLLVLLVPVQAVVWPMGLLTHWPLDIVLALAGATASWAILSAGVLACAFNAGSASARWGWMLVCVLIAITSPTTLTLWPGNIPTITRGVMLHASPLTAPWALTSAPSGLAPMMQPWEWALVTIPAASGAILWWLARRFAPAPEAGYSVSGPGPKDEAGRGIFRGRWLF